MDSAEMMLPQPQWEVLCKCLGQGPQSLAGLCSALAPSSPSPAELLVLLVGSGVVLPVFERPPDGAAARRFNAAAARVYAGNPDQQDHLALASTYARGGVPATALHLRAVAELSAAAKAAPETAGLSKQALASCLAVWQGLGVL
jgi:hypothetical protein